MAVSTSSSISAQMHASANLHVPVPSHLLVSTPLSSTLSLEQPSNQSRTLFRSSATCHQPLSPAEVRLFHTLHHLMFYRQEKELSLNRNRFFSLNVVELFIYLFMPYIHTYVQRNQREFFVHAELTAGMQAIWQPLFEYHQPNIPMFNTFIKAAEEKLFASVFDLSDKASGSPTGTIPIAKSQDIRLVKPAKAECQSQLDSQTDSDSVFDLYNNALSSQDSQLQAPLVHMSSICSISDFNRASVTTQNAGREIDLDRKTVWSFSLI